jgi:hypothetical protein
MGQNQPSVRLIFAGGDGLKTAHCFLAEKLLEMKEKEGKRDCVLPSTSE